MRFFRGLGMSRKTWEASSGPDPAYLGTYSSPWPEVISKNNRLSILYCAVCFATFRSLADLQPPVPARSKASFEKQTEILTRHFEHSKLTVHNPPGIEMIILSLLLAMLRVNCFLPHRLSQSPFGSFSFGCNFASRKC